MDSKLPNLVLQDAKNDYSLHPKIFELFDWNTNIKESMRNL
jgi:hypothetical protein